MIIAPIPVSGFPEKNETRKRYDAKVTAGAAAADIRMGKYDYWIGPERIVLDGQRWYDEYGGTLTPDVNGAGIRRVDNLISRIMDLLLAFPVLIFSIATWSSVSVGWCLVAGGVLQPNLALILILQFLMGLFAALVGMANTRLAMAVIPAMGRNHFFALLSVLGSVSLGLAPILWGLLIDAAGQWHATWLGVQWNRYSLFFAAVAVAFGGALFLTGRLQEPTAASMEELLKEILIQSPQRVWVRLWPRE